MKQTILLMTAVALAVLLAATAALVGLSGTAEAAFPGKSGKIAYHRAFDFWAKNASLSSPETKLFDDAAHLTYSPDGSRVAFMRDNEIYVANANGSGTPRNLTKSPLLDWHPAWSHDGTRIAFQRRGSDNVNNIWTMNADGTAQKQLTTETSFSPAWSVPIAGVAPDGKIAFVRGGAIWTMLANGTGQAELSYTCPTVNGGICDNAVGNPTFSPDGSEIAAEYFGDIFVAPSGGGTSRVLLPGPDNKYPGSEGDPAWSPDGTKIAFEHNGNIGGSQYGIYWAKADGSSTQAMQLTAKTGEVDPDWQPIPQCTKTGTAGNDTITGTAAKDVLCGLGGNDTINGTGGNDIIFGQGGNDRIIGGLGNDTINGGPGIDTALYSGSKRVTANLATEFAKGVGLDVLLGIENLSGSGANDRLTGSALANKLVGGAGADNMFGLAGADTINSRDGVNGNDSLSGGPGTDTKITDATEKSIVGFP